EVASQGQGRADCDRPGGRPARRPAGRAARGGARGRTAATAATATATACGKNADGERDGAQRGSVLGEPGEVGAHARFLLPQSFIFVRGRAPGCLRGSVSRVTPASSCAA